MLYATVATKIKYKSCCDKCCKDGDCYTNNIQTILDLLYAIDKKISDYITQEVKKIQWGYNYQCMSQLDAEWLGVYRRSIERYYRKMRNGTTNFCICDNQFQKIKEKAMQLIDWNCVRSTDRSDTVIDRSGREEWIAAHPTCVIYEKWEKAICNIVPKFEISVEKTYDTCKFYYTLVKEADDTSNQIPRMIATIEKAQCDNLLSLRVLADEDRCKLSFNAIVKQTKCNMTYQTYVSLLKCNLSPNVIVSAVKCGLDLGYDVVKSCPTVKLGAQVINIDDLFPIVNAIGDNLYFDDLLNTYQ